MFAGIVTHVGKIESSRKSGDGLRHRIAVKPSRSTSTGDDAEEKERPASEKIEGKNFPQRLRIGDEPEQAESDQDRSA